MESHKFPLIFPLHGNFAVERAWPVGSPAQACLAAEIGANGSAMTDLETLDLAAALVRTVVPPTPQYCWPLLSRRVGAELWVKHENHTPIGAFKLRGGLVYLDDVRRSQPRINPYNEWFCGGAAPAGVADQSDPARQRAITLETALRLARYLSSSAPSGCPFRSPTTSLAPKRSPLPR